MPWLVLAAPLAAMCHRMTRASVAEALDEDFIRTARAKGVTQKRVMRRHALRAALPPVVGLVSVSVALMVTNVVLIEPAFQLPGFFRMADIGQFRGEQSHVPSMEVVQALVLEAAVLISVTMFLADLLPAKIDPRAGAPGVARRGARGCALRPLAVNTAATAMGQDVAARVFSRADRQRYREKVRTPPGRLRAHAGRRALRAGARIVRPRDRAQPDRRRRPAALANAAVLEAIADPDFQTELGQFNIEINIAPRQFAAAVFAELEEAIRGSLNHAEDRSRTAGAT